MDGTGRNRRALRFAAFGAVWLLCGELLAQEDLLIPRSSTWRFLAGRAEPSEPLGAWREIEFTDSGWEELPAPFGFNDGPFGTDLATFDPPMRRAYSSIYLRHDFAIDNPPEVRELRVHADYDDGFVVWINGVEVLRVNVDGEPGEHVPFDGGARRGRESGEYEEFIIADPSSVLVPGRNVLAVHALNVSVSSNDFKIDLDLVDPFGPDVTPPVVRSIAPRPGARVRELTSIQVAFDEGVTGVDASDLLIGGNSAVAVAGSGAGPYVFSFPSVPFGAVNVAWSADHDIVDLARTRNAFGGGAWTYSIDADAPDPIQINEIVAVNYDSLIDEDGLTPDWIEIANLGAEPVDLGGWSLSDDPLDSEKWIFPDVTIAPGEYLVLFASGADRREVGDGRELHTNFQLAGEGEFLGLFTPGSPRELASGFDPAYPPQRGDVSFGQTLDGDLAYFDTPTPGAENAAATVFAGIVAAPSASVEHGFFTTAFSLALASTPADAAIYYTLDGSVPTPDGGTPYVAPFTVAGTPERAVVTVRAVAYRDRFLPSRTSTFTYVFPERVLDQPNAPAGFPSTWGNARRILGDYEMDPEVLANPDVVARAQDGLVSIPTLSIVMPLEDLFDPTRGIYSNAASEGIAWERGCSAELIYPSGKEGFQIDAGLRIQGGSSTRDWKSPKLSLRLLFKGDYGAAKLEHDLFPDAAVSRFDTLVLDAGLNLTWHHPGADQQVQAQYVRDQFIADRQIAAGWVAPHGVFVNLYVNGLFWGLYDLHEKPDASFLAEYFGGHKLEYDAIRHAATNVVDGDSRAWQEVLGLMRAVGADPDRLLALEDHIDIDDHIDYMIANLWAGNTDWARHNWYVGRRRVEGARWRFFSWDAEHVLKSPGENRTSVADGGSPAEIYSRLRTNPEYRLRFADRVQRHFFAGGQYWVDADEPSWDPNNSHRNRPAASYMERIDEVDTAILLESARWGDYRRARPYTRDGEFQRELDRLLRTYFPSRSPTVLEQFRRTGLFPRVAAPTLNRRGGVVPGGFELTMELPPDTEGTIWFTLDGSDPRVYGTGDVSATAMPSAEPIAIWTNLTVRARVLSHTTWSALEEAIFTVPRVYYGLRITEILYNTPSGPAYEFVELGNLGDDIIDLSGMRFTDGIEFAFPDDVTLAPGEFFVIAADAEAFMRRYPDVVFGGVYAGQLANGGERLTIEDARGRLVETVAYDDEGFWPLSPDGFAHSLVLADADGDPSAATTWRGSAELHGSPGAVDPAPPWGEVVVSEILARSTTPFEDAIELWNPTDAPVDIGGWFLSDDRQDLATLTKFRIPDGTVIEPGGFRVFYENELDATPGDPRSFALDGAGDDVYLSSADANRDLTGYITGLRFRGTRENASYGLVFTSAGVDVAALSAPTFGADVPTSVEEFRTGPGLANAAPAVGPVVINEISYHPRREEQEFVELYNVSDAPVELFDPASGRGWRLRGVSQRADDGRFEFRPGARIETRGYLLVVAGDPEFFRARYAVPDDVPIVGAAGRLDNGGEMLRLLAPMPEEAEEVPYREVDHVRYDDASPWPSAADGDGPSLERVLAAEYGNEARNWEASGAPNGTPGRRNSVSPEPGNEPPNAAFIVEIDSGPAPLEVRFDASTSRDVDGDVVAFRWDFGDETSATGPVVAHVYDLGGEYDVTLTATDDRGAVGRASATIAVEDAVRGGLQTPGDGDQDGTLTLADAVFVLDRLFRGVVDPLPCDGDAVNEGASLTLLDINGDGNLDLSDPIFTLEYLFLQGPPPALGASCVRIDGCRDVCAR